MSQNNDDSSVKNCSRLMILQLKPRRIKKDNKIKIDISKTEYPLLKLVSMNQMGWRIWTRQQSKEQINLFWVDTYVSDQQIKKMKTYQKINHIPGSQNLGKKNLLSYNINQMKKKSLRDYNFYPATFNIPADIQELQKFGKSRDNQYFIVKPCSDSQGRGIYLGCYNQLNTKQELVVQEYVENALLIEKMKFDLRIYVLVKSIFPLKIYVYQQGLCRLATCQYERPSQANKKNMKMHLTNYAINKLSPNFIFNKSEDQDHLGHKRSFSAAMKTMEQMGCDINKLSDQIDAIIVKTILSSYSTISKKYKQLAKQHEQSLCFQILGFDILIKDNFQPILLQVNHSPSFCTQTPLDLVIKKYLILDTLNLMNFNHDDKINYLKNNKTENDTNIFPFNLKIPKHPLKENQPEQLGGYRKIYPLDASMENHQMKARTYDNIFKIIKVDRMARFNRSSLYHNSTKHQAKRINKQELESIISNNTKLQSQNKLPFSFYNIMSNYSRTNKYTPEQYDECNKVSFNRQEIREKQEQLNLFDAALNDDFMMKKQMLSFEKRIRKQKKKGILVMPLNSINIKLDEKYSHRQSKSQNPRVYHQHNQYPFKIHSILNANNIFQNLKYQDNKLIKNVLKKFKQCNQIQKNHKGQPFNLTNYSAFIDQQTKRSQVDHQRINNRQFSQLKQRLQRVNLTSVMTNKIKKNDRGHYILIRNKSKSKDHRPQTHRQ